MLTKVFNTRLGKGGAKLFFAVAIGEEGPDGEVFTHTIRDCVLREGTKGDFVSFPSKPRTKKVRGIVDGQEQDVYIVAKDDAGKAIYDAQADLYFEGKGDERQVTKAAWAFKDQITMQAVDAYKALSASEGGRGPSAGAGAAKAPQQFGQSTGGARHKTPFNSDADDEFDLF